MNRLRSLWATYGKSIIAFAFAVYTAVTAALPDGHISAPEWVQIAVATATAAGVWLVPLHPGATWVKTGLAVLLAVLNVVATAIANGAGPSLGSIILATLTTLGVASVPAKSTVPVPATPGR